MIDEKTSEDVAKDDAAEAKEAAVTAADVEAGATKDSAAEAEAEPGTDSASPEAIARRVAALGEEDQTEQLAREEERKLA